MTTIKSGNDRTPPDMAGAPGTIAQFGEVGHTYPGGKNGAGVYQRIINHMPPHTTYIEPFLGSGAIMRMKRPARSSIGIDADTAVLAMFPARAAPNLTLVHGNAIDWLANNDVTSDTLIYLDPPYLMSTRRQYRLIYRYELTDQEHATLLQIIKGLDCMVIISGYWSEMYAKTLAGWRTDSFQTMTRGGSLATEWLWMNYPTPMELHDYRYLGNDFRERERIKRKKDRWKRRLQNMPALERYAILSVLWEFGTDPTNGNDDVARAPNANSDDGRRQTSPTMAMPPEAPSDIAIPAGIVMSSDKGPPLQIERGARQ